MKFPTFKYSDLPTNTGGFASDMPNLASSLSSGTPKPTGLPSGLSFDEALGYAIMQNADPEARAKARKQELQDLLSLQKEQMKEAYPYLLSKQIPDIISQGFGASNALRLLGAERGTEAALRGVDAISRSQFAPLNPLQSFNYFS